VLDRGKNHFFQHRGRVRGGAHMIKAGCKRKGVEEALLNNNTDYY